MGVAAIRLIPERQCEGCTRQKDYGCEARLIETVDGREFWINKGSQPTKVLGDDYWACPRQTLRENPVEWNRILFFYDLFKKGHLPDEGSISSQSNAMMEILRILDNENRDCDKIISEKEARKASRGKPRGGKKR